MPKTSYFVSCSPKCIVWFVLGSSIFLSNSSNKDMFMVSPFIKNQFSILNPLSASDANSLPDAEVFLKEERIFYKRVYYTLYLS